MDEKNQTGSTESKESEEHVKQDYLAPEHDGASEDIEEEAALERERQRLREERRERRRQKEAAQKAAQRRKLFLFLLRYKGPGFRGKKELSRGSRAKHFRRH